MSGYIILKDVVNVEFYVVHHILNYDNKYYPQLTKKGKTTTTTKRKNNNNNKKEKQQQQQKGKTTTTTKRKPLFSI